MPKYHLYDYINSKSLYSFNFINKVFLPGAVKHISYQRQCHLEDIFLFLFFNILRDKIFSLVSDCL